MFTIWMISRDSNRLISTSEILDSTRSRVTNRSRVTMLSIFLHQWPNFRSRSSSTRLWPMNRSRRLETLPIFQSDNLLVTTKSRTILVDSLNDENVFHRLLDRHLPVPWKFSEKNFNHCHGYCFTCRSPSLFESVRSRFALKAANRTAYDRKRTIIN